MKFSDKLISWGRSSKSNVFTCDIFTVLFTYMEKYAYVLEVTIPDAVLIIPDSSAKLMKL